VISYLKDLTSLPIIRIISYLNDPVRLQSPRVMAEGIEPPELTRRRKKQPASLYKSHRVIPT
jgi:hypothetical protein